MENLVENEIYIYIISDNLKLKLFCVLLNRYSPKSGHHIADMISVLPQPSNIQCTIVHYKCTNICTNVCTIY